MTGDHPARLGLHLHPSAGSDPLARTSAYAAVYAPDAEKPLYLEVTPAYHPGMMVALLLYGYSLGLYSSRQLARVCEERVDVMRWPG